MYYDDPPLIKGISGNEYLTTNKLIQLFIHINKYNQSSTSDYYLNKEFDSYIIYNFYHFFIDHEIWKEDYRYPSNDCFLNTLDYLNELDKTIFSWAVCNSRTDIKKFNFESDIKLFSLALFDEEKLPDSYKYILSSDDDIELFNYSYPYDIDEIKNEIAKKNTPISH